MGTASKDQNTGTQGTQGETTQGGGSVQGGVGSPITNEAYNVITALQAKLEGLEAYRKYAKDPNGQMWQQMTQFELQGVQCLVDELEKLVRDGKFRMKQPGQAH
jgi:hypothetical protein